MKNIKTTICVILAVVMLLSLFAGCGAAPIPASITVDATDLELVVGDVCNISYAVDPADTSVAFISSDSDVAMVDATGRVAALSVGETDITLSAENAESVVVKVTVTEPAEEPEEVETVTGVVKEATMNNLVLELEDGTLLDLVTTDADVSGLGENGILLGTTLTIDYSTGEDSVAVAKKLTFEKAPEADDEKEAVDSASSAVSTPAGNPTPNTSTGSMSSAPAKTGNSNKSSNKNAEKAVSYAVNLEIYDWETPAYALTASSYAGIMFVDEDWNVLAHADTWPFSKIGSFGYPQNDDGLIEAFNDYRGITSNSGSTATKNPDTSKPGISSSSSGDNEGATEEPPNAAGDVYEVIRLINNERVKAGLDELEIDDTVMTMAQTRAEECADVNSLYVDGKAHTRPDGSDWKTVFGDNGLDIPKKRGENCGAGPNRSTASSQVTAWMNSSGHKDNMLQDGVTTIGVGYAYSDGSHYWVMIVAQ